MKKKILKRVQNFLLNNKSQTKEVNNTNTVFDRLMSEISEFKIVFDIGTYHGRFIDQIIHLNPKIFLHCFEPSPESYSFLSEKYKNVHNIKLNNCAASNYTGTASININAFQETNSLLESAQNHETINLLTTKQFSESVGVVELNEYCYKNNIGEIDFMKIDTQGNSFNVLSGIESMLKTQKIRYLYVEAEFVEIYKNEKLFSEIELLMRAFGYAIIDLYNMNYLNKGHLAWCDVLFGPKSKF